MNVTDRRIVNLLTALSLGAGAASFYPHALGIAAPITGALIIASIAYRWIYGGFGSRKEPQARQGLPRADDKPAEETQATPDFPLWTVNIPASQLPWYVATHLRETLAKRPDRFS